MNAKERRYLTMGSMQSIRAKAFKIPKNTALMTFDNYLFSMIVQPTLTAIEVDMYEMGWQASHFMLQMIRKSNLQTQSYCTTPAIIERKSMGNRYLSAEAGRHISFPATSPRRGTN